MVSQAALSSDGSRLHLHHGPIDLIISVDGPDGARTCAFAAATSRFDGLLDELVSELDALRTPLVPDPAANLPETINGTAAVCGDASVRGATARRMVAAVTAYRDRFAVTPMAAVAGAVADEIGAAIAGSDPSDRLTRWMVNNGGDIALRLAPGHTYRLGVIPNPGNPSGPWRPLGIPRVARQLATSASAVMLTAEMRVGGVATSGRHGRSFSLGIADAVTVFASNAATADAAATMIANQVDLPRHPAIERLPANELEHDNDLRDRLVTTSVGNLTGPEISTALHAGLSLAEELVKNGTIIAAALHLLDSTVSTAATFTVALPHHPGELADALTQA